MDYKVNLDVKSESGNYILQSMTSTGFVRKKTEVTLEEMPQLMEELCSLTGEDNVIDTLRTIYKLDAGIKSIKFKEK